MSTSSQPTRLYRLYIMLPTVQHPAIWDVQIKARFITLVAQQSVAQYQLLQKIVVHDV